MCIAQARREVEGRWGFLWPIDLWAAPPSLKNSFVLCSTAKLIIWIRLSKSSVTNDFSTNLTIPCMNNSLARVCRVAPSKHLNAAPRLEALRPWQARKCRAARYSETCGSQGWERLLSRHHPLGPRENGFPGLPCCGSRRAWYSTRVSPTVTVLPPSKEGGYDIVLTLLARLTHKSYELISVMEL